MKLHAVEGRLFMTSNQINYFRSKEDQRHNYEMEKQGRSTIAENVRHNKESESIGYGNVGAQYAGVAAQNFATQEAMRHNQTTEAQGWFLGLSQVGLQSAQSKNQLATAQAQTQNAATNQYNAQTNRLKAVGNLGFDVAAGFTSIAKSLGTRRLHSSDFWNVD